MIIEDVDPNDNAAASRRLWMEKGLPEPSAFELMVSLLRAHAMMVSNLEEALRSFELGTSRYLLLTTLLLSRTGARRMSRLGRDIMVHPTTVTVVVDQLVRQGLVERVDHPTDRRVTLIRILPAGRSIAQDAGRALAEIGFGLEDVGATKRRKLIALLTELRALGGDIRFEPTVGEG